MSAHGTTFLRACLLQLLDQPSGASLAQVAQALRDYDPYKRVGPLFQAMREGGDIAETGERGMYTVTAQGRSWLTNIRGHEKLPRDVVLPEPAAVAPRVTQPTERPSAYKPPPQPKCRIDQVVDPERPKRPRTPTVVGSESSGDGVRQLLVDILTEADEPLSMKEIMAARPWQKKSGAVYAQLWIAIRKEGRVQAVGPRSARRYTLAGRSVPEPVPAAPPETKKPREKPVPVKKPAAGRSDPQAVAVPSHSLRNAERLCELLEHACQALRLVLEDVSAEVESRRAEQESR